MTHTLSLILTYDFVEGGQLKGDNITIKNVLLLFYIITLRTVIDHRMCKNMVRTSVTHSTGPPVPLFLFLPHFDVIYYRTDPQQPS